MYGSELRTCVLGAVVSVLLGAGGGLGWHYFSDSAGGRAVAAATTPLTQQDAPNSPSANPPAPTAGPVLEGPHSRFIPLPATSRTQPAQGVRQGSHLRKIPAASISATSARPAPAPNPTFPRVCPGLRRKRKPERPANDGGQSGRGHLSAQTARVARRGTRVLNPATS